MDYINRKAAKDIVKDALSEVGDFNGDFESFTFTGFHQFHKKVFLNTLKNKVNKTECSGLDGHPTSEAFFDIQLTDSKIDEWPTFSDCIDYVTNSHYRVKGKAGKIHLP